jgi:hypothetical protein
MLGKPSLQVGMICADCQGLSFPMITSLKRLELFPNEFDQMDRFHLLLSFRSGDLETTTRMSSKLSFLTSRSEASDVIGWLDFGILGALNKKYLKSLIVVVYLKEETRNK